MSLRVTQLDDLEEARQLHSLSFKWDEWVGDDHTFWVAHRDGELVGFASAILWQHLNVVFLSRCAVVKSAKGAGVQRHLVRARVRWAKRLQVDAVETYVLLKNYGSMVNLLRCGFRFYRPKKMYVGSRVHYLRRELTE
jgi:GNAT superfamily N-acetyltransferase